MATVQLKVQLDPSGAIKNIGLVGEGLHKAGKQAGAFQSILQGIGQGFGQQLYSGLMSVGGALVNVTSAAVDYADKFQNLSDRTGLGVEALQKYSFVAKAAGTDVEAVAGAATKLGKNLYEGTAESAKAVLRLGLSFKDLRNQSPETQMESVLGAISKLPNPTERSALALQLLGKAGAALIPLGGSFKGLSEQAERLGLVLSASTVKALDDLGDEVGAMSATWEGFKNQIGGVIATSEPLHVLITGVTELMGQLSGAVKGNETGLRSFVDQGVVLAAGALVGLVDVIQAGMNVWDGLQLAWISSRSLIADLGIAINKYGEVYSKVFLGGLGASYFKENQVLLEGMKRATIEETDAVLASSSKRADAMGKARGALVTLQKDVVASVGKSHAAADASNKHAGGLLNVGKAAEEAAAKLQKAAEAAAKWAKEQTSKETEESLKGQLEGLKDLEEADRERIQAALDGYNQMRKAAIEQTQYEEALAKEEEERLHRKVALIQEVAGAISGFFADMSTAADDWADRASKAALHVGDALAALKMGDKLQALSSGLQAAGAMFGEYSKTGGALSGAGRGAAIGTSILPGWGTAIGAVVGGIFGFIGAKKKAEKAMREMTGAIMQQYGSIGAAEAAAQKYGINLKAAMDSKDPKKLAAAMKELGEKTEATAKKAEILKEAMARMVAGVSQWAGKLEGASEAQARIFGAAFWATVKEQGLTSAVDAFAEPFARMREQFPDLMAPLGQLFDKLGAGTPFRAAAEAAQGLNDTMMGLAGAGYLNVSMFNDFQAAAQAAYDQAIAGGATSAEALQVMLPLLANAKALSEKYGYTLDENTQAMIDQAEAAGYAFPTDPMLAMLDVLVEIAKVLGADIPEAARRAKDGIEGIPPPPDPSGYGHGGQAEAGEAMGRGGFLGYAARGMVVPPRRGGWAIAGEAGQHEVVAPVAALFGSLGNQIAGQVAAAVGAGGGPGPSSIIVQLVTPDRKVLSEQTVSLIRDDAAVRSELKRASGGRY